MTNLAATRTARVTPLDTETDGTTPRNAPALPTSEVVVAAYGGDATYNVLSNAPTGDTNHVLCRSHDEPLSDFGRRVEWRLQALRRKSSIRKVSYLLGPQLGHDWLSSRQAIIALIGLLNSGAEFEIVAAPTWSVDVVQILDELMPHAQVGVRVSIRRERPPISDEPGRNAHGEAYPNARAAAADGTHAAPPAHPGLAHAKPPATSSFEDASSSGTLTVWS